MIRLEHMDRLLHNILIVRQNELPDGFAVSYQHGTREMRTANKFYRIECPSGHYKKRIDTTILPKYYLHACPHCGAQVKFTIEAKKKAGKI